MTAVFPGAFPDYDNPTAAMTLGSADHVALHSDINDDSTEQAYKLGKGTYAMAAGKVLRAISSTDTNYGPVDEVYLDSLKWVDLEAQGSAPGAPAAGALRHYLNTNGFPVFEDSSSRITDGRSVTNRLINPGQENWGLGASIAVPASTTSAAGYGPDGWCLRTGANQACVIDQVTGLTTGSTLASRVRRNSGQSGTTALVYEQFLETAEILPLRGGYVTFAVSLKAGANFSPVPGNLKLRAACGTGTQGRRGAGFTSETTLVDQTFPVTTSTSQISAVSSVVVPTNATQLSVWAEWQPFSSAGAADDVTFDDFIFVPGAVLPPFNTRPDDFVKRSNYPESISGMAIGPAGLVGTPPLYGLRSYGRVDAPVIGGFGRLLLNNFSCTYGGNNSVDITSVLGAVRANSILSVVGQTGDISTHTLTFLARNASSGTYMTAGTGFASANATSSSSVSYSISIANQATGVIRISITSGVIYFTVVEFPLIHGGY